MHCLSAPKSRFIVLHVIPKLDLISNSSLVAGAYVKLCRGHWREGHYRRQGGWRYFLILGNTNVPVKQWAPSPRQAWPLPSVQTACKLRPPGTSPTAPVRSAPSLCRAAFQVSSSFYVFSSFIVEVAATSCMCHSYDPLSPVLPFSSLLLLLVTFLSKYFLFKGRKSIAQW